ncbi:hypothetical protein AAFF_G00334990 [Aldrovandia affinis]|uniref:Uncharacterized protein n=1 Tax=Aldrovandia affinis TaxID=143900 RepID=A0AAD7WPI1_9TELE|nr:hypothetical protein AAFF_G00334990 [Aldrovandia affinis]
MEFYISLFIDLKDRGMFDCGFLEKSLIQFCFFCIIQLDQMRADNFEKDKKIAILENRVADLEQYTRINDVIITGLSIKPRSYARAVTPENGGG